MPISVTACSVCSNDVKKALDRAKIPYQTSAGRGRTKFSINCSSPSSWPGDSLSATCWRNLQFTYHAAKRNGDTIKCSNC